MMSKNSFINYTDTLYTSDISYILNKNEEVSIYLCIYPIYIHLLQKFIILKLKLLC